MGFSRRRLLVTIGVIVAILGALVGAERFLIAWRQSIQPTGEAQWIWMRGANRFLGASAFYVARDFDLEFVPAVATLSVLGDEEYVLYLNGARVGSNRYSAGAPLDRYRVESLLVTGRNRFLVHLRSSRSEGAFLALLQSPEIDSPIVWTDSEWRKMRRRLPKVAQGEAALEPSDGRSVEHAVVVARPPEGRWGSPGSGLERPLHQDLVRPRNAAPASRIMIRGGGWRRRYPRIRYTRPLGPHVTFDWGGVRTGYLVLHFRAGERSVALVYLGQEMPDPLSRAPDAYVITSSKDSHWEDTVPRAFRYALVVGLAAVSDAELILTHADRLTAIAADGPGEGVFGLSPPRLRSAIEDKVWRELEGFAGDSEGQD